MAWRRSAAEPDSLKARPYLALCIAFKILKKCFSSFWAERFFLRTCLRYRDQNPLAPIGKYFARKGETRGDSCAGSRQTWPVLSPEAKLVFEKPPRAREGSLPKTRENTCNLPKNVVLKNPFRGERRLDSSLDLCRVTDVMSLMFLAPGVLNAVFSVVCYV